MRDTWPNARFRWNLKILRKDMDCEGKRLYRQYYENTTDTLECYLYRSQLWRHIFECALPQVGFRAGSL